MTNGIRVAKPGYAVETASPKRLVFSSEYATFRVQQQGSGTITHTGGRTITIPHNLGYVPVFLVHGTLAGDSNYYILPSTNTGTIITPTETTAWATADSTNLYINVDSDYGFVTFNVNDAFEESGGTLRGFFGYGHNFAGLGDMKGALRFGSVAIAKNASIYDSSIGIHVDYRYGSSQMYCAMYGIDEDNTADFSSTPLGRPKTTARARPEANPSVGQTLWFGCTNQVQEVVNRGGWSSGNNMGFIFQEDGGDQSPDGNGFYSDVNSGHYLKVLDHDTLLNYKYTIFKDKIE